MKGCRWSGGNEKFADGGVVCCGYLGFLLAATICAGYCAKGFWGIILEYGGEAILMLNWNIHRWRYLESEILVIEDWEQSLKIAVL